MALSNNYLDCEVLNLDPDDPRHWPFVITESAADPNDPSQRANLYLLRSDRSWIEYATHAPTQEVDRVPMLFDGLETIVRDEDLDQGGLANFLKQVQASAGMRARIRKNVVRYKTQKQL